MSLPHLSRPVIRRVSVCFERVLFVGLPDDSLFQTRLRLYSISPILLYVGSNLVASFLQKEAANPTGVSLDISRYSFTRREITLKLLQIIEEKLDVFPETAEGLFVWCMDIVRHRPLFFERVLAEYDVRNRKIHFHYMMPYHPIGIRWKIDSLTVQKFLNLLQPRGTPNIRPR